MYLVPSFIYGPKEAKKTLISMYSVNIFTVIFCEPYISTAVFVRKLKQNGKDVDIYNSNLISFQSNLLGVVCIIYIQPQEIQNYLYQ